MWLTIDELSEHLKISRETIYKMAKSKKIPSSKIGNQWRFNKEIIDRWLVGETDCPIETDDHSTNTNSVEAK